MEYLRTEQVCDVVSMACLQYRSSSCGEPSFLMKDRLSHVQYVTLSSQLGVFILWLSINLRTFDTRRV